MNNFSKTLTSLFLISAGLISTGNVLAADQIHFHPLEAFQIKYIHEGMMTGESTQQCRKWCREMVSTMNQNMLMMGATRSINLRTISIEDKNYVINLKTGTAVEEVNPMYESMMETGKNASDDPSAFAQQWMNALGYERTGNSRTILGEDCKDYTSQELEGTTICITNDGLTLRMEMNMGPQMSSVQTAVEINRNEPGDDADYEIPADAKPAAPMAGLEQMDLDQIDLQQLDLEQLGLDQIDLEQLQEMLKNL